MTLDLDTTLSLCCMLMPSLIAEWSFDKCTNASFFPLLSLLMGFDKLICVCVCSLSCLAHCANTLEFDPILITEMKMYVCLLHSVHFFFPLQPSNTASISARMQSIPDHPRTRTSGVHTRVQQEHFVTGCLLSGCLCQSQPTWITYFLTDSCLWDFCS